MISTVYILISQPTHQTLYLSVLYLSIQTAVFINFMKVFSFKQSIEVI